MLGFIDCGLSCVRMLVFEKKCVCVLFSVGYTDIRAHLTDQ